MPLKSNSTPTKTVLIIVVGFSVIYYITNAKEFLLVAIGLGGAGALSTWVAMKIDFLWMKLSYLLSLVVPNIILSVVFFLFLTPIALLSRVFGQKNPLGLKNLNDSQFKDHKQQIDQSWFEKPW